MLRVSGLQARYGESHVLRGIDFELPAGTSLGLLGRNGMGKTTLMRTLMGLTRATAGRIEWEGEDVTGWPPERMARLGLGYVPEGRGIFPNLSVRENLVMAARRRGAAAVDWTLERVLATFPRLAQRLSHGGGQLSGGEQQMLSIARALMTQPRMLLLDEATEGLAPQVVAEIWRVLGQIQASGIGALVVDRNPLAVLAHCEEGMVMEKGRIVLAGPSHQLAGSPQTLERLLGV